MGVSKEDSMTAGEFCTRKVITIHRDDTLVEAAQRIRKHHVGTLIVVDEKDGQRIPVGMLTDRDLVLSVLTERREHTDGLVVGDVMTDHPITGKEDEELFDALNRMRNSGVRRLPVVNGEGSVVGILTFDDLIELLADELSSLSSLIFRERRRECEARP
jgi:CBS domain-containing protein